MVLRLVDPNLDFWAMEFPAPNPFEPGDNLMPLECSLCQTQHNVEQGAIEEDVYSVNGYILFYCWECGASTPWKKADGIRPEAPAGTGKPSFKPSGSSPASSAPKAPFVPPEPAFAESFESVHAASRVPLSSEQTSSYSDASEISEFASFSEVQTSPVAANAIAVLPPPTPAVPSAPAKVARPGAKPEQARARELDANGRRINKRRHVRIRVSFSACVRHPEHADQVVECENVSKGGVCFHSLQQYELGDTIEVAAPYSPGETALFIPARIQRIEPLSGGLVFRYGIEYMNSFPSH
jgi:PilZ domain